MVESFNGQPQPGIVPEKYKLDLIEAQECESRYIQNSDQDSLVLAAASWDRILNDSDFFSSELAFRLFALNSAGEVHLRQHWSTGDGKQLERALTCWENALQLVPPDSKLQPVILNNLGIALVDQFNLSQELPLLRQAISAHERSVELTEVTSQDLASRLSNLGVALNTLFEQTGDLNTLEKANQAYEQSVAHTPAGSPHLALRLNNLGTGLSDRYDIKGDSADLDKALEAYQQALRNTAADSTQLPYYLNNNASGLICRYRSEGRLDDLLQAIRAYRESVKKTSSGSPTLAGRLNNLAIALRTEYVRTGKQGALEEAIQAWERAVDMAPANSPELARYLHNLGNGLCDDYALTGKVDAIERAAIAYARAVKFTPLGSPELGRHLNGLGIGLRFLYEKTGELSLLKQSIDAHKKSVARTPPDSPERVTRLNNLAGSLRSLYNYNGDLSLLQAAIRFYEEVVNKTPPDSPELPAHLNNLANALRDYHERTRNISHLKNALESFQLAVDKIPYDFPGLHRYLSNIGACLIDNYQQTGNPDDLETAISLFERALETSQSHTSSLPAIFNNLSLALRNRYHQVKDVTDLERAVEAAESAVNLSQQNFCEQMAHTINLAGALKDRYALKGCTGDAERSKQYYREAARTSMGLAADARLTAARAWGDWALDRKSWSEAVEAYECANQASELLVRTQLVRGSKELWLRETQGLYARFAFALAKLGDLSAAVVALEQGQARLLSETLKRNNADLQSLRLKRPDLYASYVEAAERISRMEESNIDIDGPSPFPDLPDGDSGLNAVVEKIRSVQGYEHFLIASNFADVQDTLRALPGTQALIYLAVTNAGSLAIVLDKVNTNALWLEFSESKLNLTLTGNESGDIKDSYLSGLISGSKQFGESLKQVLKTVGEQVMATVASFLRERTFKNLVLIPTGRFSLIPLQSTFYTIDGKLTYFLDEFTVTYAPNAHAMAEATRLATRRGDNLSLAAVANPLPNSRPLKGAEFEVGEIAAYFPKGSKVVLCAEAANRDALLLALPEATYLHFACHGNFNPREPMNSFLQLSGQENLYLQDILSGIARPAKARLAVLSACQSAVSDFRELPDEVIGFPALLLQAGVPGVIGTLWQAEDLATALLMAKFYEFHFRGNSQIECNAMTPACALRHAQLWLREVTSGQLTAYYEDLKRRAETESRDLASASFAGVLARLSTFALDDSDTHPFENEPLSWAPFVFLGV
jgi:CHAT domain-containing protein